jgi:hypothetical protein
VAAADTVRASLEGCCPAQVLHVVLWNTVWVPTVACAWSDTLTQAAAAADVCHAIFSHLMSHNSPCRAGLAHVPFVWRRGESWVWACSWWRVWGSGGGGPGGRGVLLAHARRYSRWSVL